MPRPAHLIRILLNVVIVALFMLHTLGTVRLPLVEQLERISYDLRLRATIEPHVDERLVIADIDEESLTKLGQWPWSRSVLADMVDTLFEHYEIELLGFDIVFAEADRDEGTAALESLARQELRNDAAFQRQWQRLRNELKHDERFAESLKGRKVVMGYVFNEHQPRTQNVLPPALGPLPEPLQGQLSLVRPRGFTGNLAILQEAAGAGGYFDNPTVDADGVYRRVPLVQEYEGELYDSLALAMVRLHLGDPPFNLQTDPSAEYSFVDGIELGDREIPLEKKGAALVPYQGPQGSFPYISIHEILAREVPKETLEGKMVLVGTTAPGLLDLRTTPMGNRYPGVEVHANLVAGILDNEVRQHPGWMLGLEFILLLALGLVTSVLTGRLSPVWGLASVLILTTLVMTGNMYAWNNGMVMPLASPLLMMLSVFVVQSSFGLIMETRDRRVITRLFGQYVPPELVEEMAESPEQVSVEGESRELTVLFSDVRGFTSISEGLDPKQLTHLMNDLLTPMTRVIHEHRGTIDKYMGDAIMAFWGAPLTDEKHAVHAVHAALAMVDGLTDLNDEFRRRDWPEINIGVGLNTGQMSVGNMGSQFRMAYTVMGDAVNLGSRLEGLTKQYGVQVIVSESTREAAPEFAYRELDRVRVKGKDKPVTIYEPLSPGRLDEEAENRLKRFHAALTHYRRQEWDQAEVILMQLRDEEPDRLIYQIYIDRIQVFRKDPPPKDWDGVFTHTSK